MKNCDGRQDLWFPYRSSRLVHLVPPIALAYIGDAIYEVAVRQYVLSQPNFRPHVLHDTTTSFVSAKMQSAILHRLQHYLSPSEKQIVKQGLNAKPNTIPKNATVSQYRHATAFECLIGHLYYSDQHDRMTELISMAIKMVVDNKSNPSWHREE